MRNNKPVVAHINYSFFEKTETFIYNYISNLKRFYPIYLGAEFKNLDQFSLLMEDSYNFSIKKYSYYWFVKKAFGINIKMERILKNRRAKIIHAHFGKHGVYALQFRKRLKIPIITTFYGHDISASSYLNEYKREYRPLFNYGDLFLVEGNFMKSKLTDMGCPVEKIKIQRIAIATDKISFTPRLVKKRNEKVIFIFGGRFVEKKGLIYALQALKIVRERNKNFEMHIIGDGPLRPAIESFIKEHTMASYVKLLGFLTYRQYLDEMQKSDVFIHPSVTAKDGDSEGGAPTTILEAQAMGMPVISTLHADIPNVVVPGKSALLAKERDIDGLSNNILYLIENQALWGDMGKAGREFVTQYHNISNETPKLEEHYQRLINDL